MTGTLIGSAWRCFVCPGALCPQVGMLSLIIAAGMVLLVARSAVGLEYVGAAPGPATGDKQSNRLSLHNDAIRCELDIESGKAATFSITNRHTRGRLALASGRNQRRQRK